MSYLGNSPTIKSRIDFTYLAANGQTVFSGPDTFSKSLSINVYEHDVFVNGRLMNKADYVATSSSITFSTGLNANDVVMVRALGAYQLANMYTKAEIDAFTVKYDAPMALSSAQKLQARQNQGILGYEFISANTLTAQTTFSLGDISAYRDLYIESIFTNSTSTANILLQVSTDNVTFVTTNYISTSVDNSAGTLGGMNAVNSTGFLLNRYSGTLNGRFLSRLMVSNLKGAMGIPTMIDLSSYLYQPSDSSTYKSTLSAYQASIAVYNYARLILVGTGTFTGQFDIWGKR